VQVLVCLEGIDPEKRGRAYRVHLENGARGRGKDTIYPPRTESLHQSINTPPTPSHPYFGNIKAVGVPKGDPSEFNSWRKIWE